MSIRSRRIAVSLTQEDIAAALGVDRTAVTKWETGKSYPTAAKLVPLAKLLGCSVDDLLQTDSDDVGNS